MRIGQIALLALMLLMPLAYPIEMVFYYGEGCPHCAATETQMQALKEQYDLSIVRKEIYKSSINRQELYQEAAKYGLSANEIGVPFIVVEGKTAAIGTMDTSNWHEIFGLCKAGACPSALYAAPGKVKDIDAAGEMPPAEIFAMPPQIEERALPSPPPETGAFDFISLPVMIVALGVLAAIAYAISRVEVKK